jgi:hypothetical protein
VAIILQWSDHNVIKQTLILYEVPVEAKHMTTKINPDLNYTLIKGRNKGRRETAYSPLPPLLPFMIPFLFSLSIVIAYVAVAYGSLLVN